MPVKILLRSLSAHSRVASLACRQVLGSLFAAPLISFCTSKSLWQRFGLSSEHWTLSLYLMIALILVLGLIAGIFYHLLYKSLSLQTSNSETSTSSISLSSSLALSFKSHPLRLLSVVVLSDYIAYGLGEVVFLQVIQLKFPDPVDYCHYMGSLAFWNGILTFVCSLFLAPWLIRRYQWIVASVMTPICLLITQTLFLFMCACYLKGEEKKWLDIIVMLGSLQYCVCRSAKYTLFDTCKEMVFLYLPSMEKIKGKLIIDGLTARLGMGISSLMSISLIKLAGGILASSSFVLIVVIGFGFSWIRNSFKLWDSMKKLVPPVLCGRRAVTKSEKV